jgi:hypothetical protein
MEIKMSKIITDRDEAIKAVEQNGDALQYASKELQGDREVVLKAVGQDGYALEYASINLKNDKAFVLKAVGKDGYALEYASEDLQGDREVVLKAVRQNGLALYYASDTLKNDPEFLQLLQIFRLTGEIKKDPSIKEDLVKFINSIEARPTDPVLKYLWNNTWQIGQLIKDDQFDYGKILRGEIGTNKNAGKFLEKLEKEQFVDTKFITFPK